MPGHNKGAWIFGKVDQKIALEKDIVPVHACSSQYFLINVSNQTRIGHTPELVLSIKASMIQIFPGAFEL